MRTLRWSGAVLVAALLAGCTATPQTESGSAPAMPSPTSPASPGLPAGPSTRPPRTAPAAPNQSGSPASSPTPAASTLPQASGVGRRIVWSKSANRVWLVAASGRVARTFAVSDNDAKTPAGRYRVQRRNYSARSATGSALDRFLGFYQRPGHTAWIGLHAVPRRAGHYTRALGKLGSPTARPTPGCLYLAPDDAEATWLFTRLGTPVVVVQ